MTTDEGTFSLSLGREKGDRKGAGECDSSVRSSSFESPDSAGTGPFARQFVTAVPSLSRAPGRASGLPRLSNCRTNGLLGSTDRLVVGCAFELLSELLECPWPGTDED